MRTFRAGRSLPPLILWGFLATGAIVLLWGPTFGTRPLQTRMVSGSLMLALVLLGPAAVALHALRCARQGVSIHPDEGLHLAGGFVVPWKALRAVKLRSAPFQKMGMFRRGDLADELESGRWLLRPFWALLYCLFLPAFAVLSPWHGRVTLSLADGSSLIFRDLHDDQDFVRLVKIGLSGRRRRP